MNSYRLLWKKFPFEAFIWVAALVALALYDYGNRSSFTLCPLKNAGFDHCPGCGLGRAMSMALHGDFEASFHAHPLGILAIIVLSCRIIRIIRTAKKE